MASIDIIHIGPFALALDRLSALGMILFFLWATDRIAVHGRVPVRHSALLALVVGLVAARLTYLFVHRESFALDPAAALKVWLGGWSWQAGVVAAALLLAMMWRRARPVIATWALLAILSLGWWALQSHELRAASLRMPAAIDLVDLEGVTTVPVELRNRPVVINLWASWCPPCRREMPMLIDRARRETGAAILLVNQGEGASAVQAYLEAQGLAGDAVLLDHEGIVGRLVGSNVLPITLFVDSRGMVQERHIGEMSAVQLDIALRALLAAEARDVTTAENRLPPKPG